MTTESHHRSALRGIAWSVVVAGVLVVLHRTGSGALAGPPLRSVEELSRWFEERDPATALFAIVRLGAVACGWYVLAVLAVGTAARLTASGRLARAVDAVTVPVVRRAVTGLLGAGLLSPVAAAAPAAADGEAIASPPTERLINLAPTETLIVIDEEASGDGEATMTLIPPSKARVLAAVPLAAPAVDTWVIQPGEHLWAIAETHLQDRLGRPPTTAETDAYWRAIVDRNRSRLLDPANPDLVVPAQSIELPPVPT
jgi:nucleoid-associated protein YgaU